MPCRVARLFGATLLLTFATAAAAQDVSSRAAGARLVRGWRRGPRARRPAGRLAREHAAFSRATGSAPRPAGSRSSSPMAARSTSMRTPPWTSSPTNSCACSTDAFGSPFPDRDRQVDYRIDAPAASVNIDAPGDYRVSVLARDRDAGGRARWSCAGAAELVNDQGRTPLRAGAACRRARRRGPVLCLCLQLGVVGRVRSLVRGAPEPAAWRLDAGPARGGAPVRGVLRRCGRLALRRVVRLRLVSDGADGVAAVPETAAGSVSALRLDLGRRGGVGLADAPLWTLGALGRCLVLDLRDEAGRRRGCRGRTRPDMSAGVRSAGTTAPCVQLVSVPATPTIRGAHGRPFRTDTSDTATSRRRRRRHVYPVRRGIRDRAGAPDVRGYAVPRSSAPIRVAGTGAGPRGGSPVYTNLEPGGARVTAGGPATMVGPTRARRCGRCRGRRLIRRRRARGPRETAGATTGIPYRPRPGELNAPIRAARSAHRPRPATASAVNVRPGSPGPQCVVATVVPAEPGSIRADRGANGRRAGHRHQPRGARLEHGALRVSAERCAARAFRETTRRTVRCPRTSASAQQSSARPRRLTAAGDIRAPDRAGSLRPRRDPEMRTPERGAGGCTRRSARRARHRRPRRRRRRAVARSMPRPAAQPASGAPSGGAHVGGSPSGGGHALGGAGARIRGAGLGMRGSGRGSGLGTRTGDWDSTGAGSCTREVRELKAD